eukprot:UN10506
MPKRSKQYNRYRRSALGAMLVAVFAKKEENEIKKYINKFQQYKDEITIKHVEGFNPKRWPKYVTSLCARYEIPSKNRDDLIDEMEGAEKSNQILHTFNFEKGSGHFCVGRFAAIKRKDNKIDFAMWCFQCDYQMPLIEIVTKKKSINIFNSEKTKVVHHGYEPVDDLRKEELAALDSYFTNRAIQLFENQAPKALLPPQIK